MSTSAFSERSSPPPSPERVEPNREENKSRWKNLTCCKKIELVAQVISIAIIILAGLALFAASIASAVLTLVEFPMIAVAIPVVLLIAIWLVWLQASTGITLFGD